MGYAMYLFIKNLFISCFFPLPLSIIIILFGLVFLWMPSKQRSGKILVTIGLSVLIIFSLPLIPNILLGNLERQYRSFEYENFTGNIFYIVVLAGGHKPDNELSLISQFSREQLYRLIEGIALKNKYPYAKLILSGGPGIVGIPDAEKMLELAIELGVKESETILESDSMSTYDEARFIKPIVKSDPFILVTSASHMNRAVALFKKMGMNPVPAPTDHLVKNYEDRGIMLLSPVNLLKSDTFIYEYLGYMKDKIAGRI